MFCRAESVRLELVHRLLLFVLKTFDDVYLQPSTPLNGERRENGPDKIKKELGPHSPRSDTSSHVSDTSSHRK